MYCRKNFTDLTVDELDRLADALNELFDDGMIEHHAHHHEEYFSNGIHRGPAFLPWHRHMLLQFEQSLRMIDARITLPYWDWTRADSRDLDVEPWESFFGGRDNTGGRFDHWTYTRAAAASGSLPTLDDVINELQAATYTDFRAMEFGSHVPGHTWTGGTMESTSSPLDPLFYLHHCNVDRLWAIWQRNHAGVTQYTLDNCAGCPSIDATFVALNDPMVGGATPASMLDHTALGYFYHDDQALENRAIELGVPAIISGDGSDITLITPQVIFNDVPEGDTTKRAALFQVESCETLSFHVTSPPGAPFSLFEPGPFPYPAGPLSTDELRIWVMFTGQMPGNVAAGVMTVEARNEFGDVLEEWPNIPIFANSVARPTVAVAMILDESGSMLADAGNNRTRLQVLQLAATTFVDQLYDDNGLALVSFAETAAELRDLQVAGDLTSSVRNDARSDIASHGPPDEFPHTCIGAGLEKAADVYNTSPLAGNFTINSSIVFTDGFEDRHPLISEVRHLINERVYAVGVGNADNVRNDILREIADNSGGFMLVTGAISQDDEFLLEKFFMQVLAGVTNRDIVRDPDGWIVPGEITRVPFSITSSDIAFDALALSRAPHFVAIALETPDGTVVGPAQVPAGSFRQGFTSSNFRITLPLVVGGQGHWEGEWNLLLAMRLIGRGLRVAAPPTFAVGQTALRFHALVHARSNLHLRASLTQSASTPGSQMFPRAVLTEYGQPLETHPQVTATMTRPDHTTQELSFIETTLGEFETSITATQTGAYRFHVRANGLTSRGQSFTREQLLTGVVGQPPRDPPVPPTDGGLDSFCELLKCLFSAGVINDRLIKQLEKLGIDVVTLRRCFEHLCRRQTIGR